MERVRLGKLVKITSGFAFKSNLFNKDENGLPLIRIRDVVRGYSDTYYEGEYKAEYLIKNGDALIGMDGEFNLALWNGGKALLNQRVCKIQSIDERLDQDYLIRFLPKALKDIEDKTPFVTVKHLSVKDINNILIPLPLILEQRRIASILDKADELRQKRQQAIKKLDQLLQATFIDMFGDPKTNPYNFDVRKLSEFYINSKNGTKCGPFGSALKRHEYVENGIPVWSMDVITLSGAFIDKPSLWVTNEKFKELESYSVEQGDVIISRAGTVGKMGVVHSQYEKSLISTNLIRVRFGKMLLPEYFVALMTYCKHRLSRLQTGADGAFTHMSTGILDNLEFPYPPIEKQKQFIDFLHMVNNNKKILLKSDKRINELFSSVQNQAFSGNL